MGNLKVNICDHKTTPPSFLFFSGSQWLSCFSTFSLLSPKKSLAPRGQKKKATKMSTSGKEAARIGKMKWVPGNIGEKSDDKNPEITLRSLEVFEKLSVRGGGRQIKAVVAACCLPRVAQHSALACALFISFIRTFVSNGSFASGRCSLPNNRREPRMTARRSESISRCRYSSLALTLYRSCCFWKISKPQRCMNQKVSKARSRGAYFFHVCLFLG